ncbi:MAG: hypothetical protein H6672_03950 [Anaerolineaceae bacterium]|nr:hypothetical protein [Anaerolineaceae bacterium]
MIELLSSYSGVPAQDLKNLLALAPQEIYQSAMYHELVRQIDQKELEQTLASVRVIYDEHLPEIKDRFQLQRTIMSGYTLGSWLLGYIAFPDKMVDLLDRHQNIPPQVIREVLPELLDLLETIPEGAAAWQQAMVIVALPLMV